MIEDNLAGNLSTGGASPQKHFFQIHHGIKAVDNQLKLNDDNQCSDLTLRNYRRNPMNYKSRNSAIKKYIQPCNKLLMDNLTGKMIGK